MNTVYAVTSPSGESVAFKSSMDVSFVIFGRHTPQAINTITNEKYGFYSEWRIMSKHRTKKSAMDKIEYHKRIGSAYELCSGWEHIVREIEATATKI